MKQRLQLREQQILDMKSQISAIFSDSNDLEDQLKHQQEIISRLEGQIDEKDKKIDLELNQKEEALTRLQHLESLLETRSKKSTQVTKKPEKNQDVATAYIEFYTRTVQEKPMFKKLPEFKEDSEPYSPPKMNDIELDEELEKLGLSDVLKKYS